MTFFNPGQRKVRSACFHIIRCAMAPSAVPTSSRSMRAFVVSSVEPPSAKVFLENELEAEEERESVVARTKKVERVLGLSDHLSAQQQLAARTRRASP